MHLYLLQQPGPVNFNEPHGFNPRTLRLYASKLGITSTTNTTHAILSSANPLPPYYLNILAKDLRVQHWIAMHYPQHIPLIISLVYDKALTEDAVYDRAVRIVKKKALAQAQRNAVEEARALKLKHKLQKFEAQAGRRHIAHSRITNEGTYTAAVHNILDKIRNHTKYSTNQYRKMQEMTMEVDGIGATIATVKVIASKYKTQTAPEVTLDPHKVRLVYDETGTIAKTAAHFNTTTTKIIDIL